MESSDISLKGSTLPMIDLGTYKFKDLNKGKITPQEYFMNYYVDELYELEYVRTPTKQLFTILDAKYESHIQIK